MKIMKALLLLLFISTNAPAAIQCGIFHINAHQYKTTVNGDAVEIGGKQFTADHDDYSNAIITLRRARITDQPYSFILTARGGSTTLEYVTNELPPRVLSRENCNADLHDFNW